MANRQAKVFKKDVDCTEEERNAKRPWAVVDRGRIVGMFHTRAEALHAIRWMFWFTSSHAYTYEAKMREQELRNSVRIAYKDWS